MSTETSYDNAIKIEVVWEKSCRACARSFDEDIMMFPIFQELTTGPKNKYKLKIVDEFNLFNIKIDENDGLPQEICLNCVEHFKQLLSFRKLCQLSQRKLRKLYDSSNEINVDDLMKSSTVNDVNLFDQNSEASTSSPSQENVNENNLLSVKFSNFGNVTSMEPEQKEPYICNTQNAVEFLPETDDYSIKSVMDISDTQSNHSNDEDCTVDNESILEDTTRTEKQNMRPTDSIMTKGENIKSLKKISSKKRVNITSTRTEKLNITPTDSIMFEVEKEKEPKKTSSNKRVNVTGTMIEKLDITLMESIMAEIEKTKNPKKTSCNKRVNETSTRIEKLDITPMDSIMIEVEKAKDPKKTSSDKKDNLFLQMKTKSIASNGQDLDIKIVHEEDIDENVKDDEVNLRNAKNKPSKIKMCSNCNKYKYLKRFKNDRNSCFHMKNEGTLKIASPFDNCCYYCDKNFKTSSIVEDHILKNHPIYKPFKCMDCGQDFSDHLNLNIHSTFDHVSEEGLKELKYNYDLSKNFEIFKCENCNKYKYSMRKRLDETFCKEMENDDTLTKSLYTDFCCYYCNENFCNITVLHDHIIKIHSYRKPFNCSKCDEKFMYCVTRKSHFNNKHSQEIKMKIIKCPICNIQLKSKLDLLKHLLNHDNDSKSNDEILDNNELNDLEKKENDAIKLCNVCKKYKFSEKIHKDKIPCGVFKKSFCAPLNPDIDYVCYYCNLNCDDKTLLTDHMLNEHSFSRPYNCSKCDERFQYYTERTCHIIDKHSKDEKLELSKPTLINENNSKSNDEILDNDELSDLDYDVITQCNICSKYKFSGSFHRDVLPCTYYKKNFRTPLNPDYVCYYCNLDCDNKDLLKGHMLNEHSFENPFNCKICNERFNSQSSRIKHYEKHHKDILPYECPICDTTLKNKTDSLDHRNRFHTDKRYECEVCLKKFYNPRSLYGHKKQHVVVPKHKCRYCDKRFHDRFKVIVHERLHTNEKPYECETCGKKFRLRDWYTTHLRLHSGKDFCICEICGKGFPAFHLLNIHIKSSHGDGKNKGIREKKSHICEMCGKSVINIRSHMDTFHGTKYKKSFEKFECSICERKFFTPLALRRHLKVHDKNRKYKCSQCPYSYNHLWALTVHVRRTHPKEGVFVCHCGKECSSLEEKKQHQKVSHPVKSFRCQYCGDILKDRKSFVTHERAHTNEKPFECLICGDSFINHPQLATHTTKVHNYVERKTIEANILAEAKIDEEL